MQLNTIYIGDCIDVMKGMPNDSVDSIVTDPPYELGFMGKSWDLTGIANSVEMWSEALRVLKPGGHLLAFSGSRTYHRMAVAIEDAGFQIRDQIMWVYGSGFPKSHNISKGIDKAVGAEPTIVGQEMARGSARKIKGTNAAANKIPNSGSLEYDKTIIYETVGTSPEAQQWDGWGTALKPAHEPIVLARKPFTGTVANNVLAYGTGGINIDGCRVVAGEENFDNLKGRQITKLATKRNGETDEEYRARFLENPAQQIALGKLKELGRFPANFIHDGSDEVLALFPDTKGGIAIRNKSGGKNFGSDTDKPPLDDIGYADSGSAARFFYCAKTSKKDRNEGLDEFEAKQSNFHPTVKPTDLMRYLVRLVTPSNGTVLDPFMGSGSTGKAAILEGFDFIGIDMTPEYVEIARARIKFAEDKLRRQRFVGNNFAQ